MRISLSAWAALAAALIPLAARAADAPDLQAEHAVQATFGNTVFSIYPDGRSQKIWLHPDGSWEGKSRRGVALSGKWTLRGDRVCLKQSHPPTLPISFCQVMPKDPEVTLTSKDLTGQTIHLKIVKGITEAGS
jgi:hypothetical protein